MAYPGGPIGRQMEQHTTWAPPAVRLSATHTGLKSTDSVVSGSCCPASLTAGSICLLFNSAAAWLDRLSKRRRVALMACSSSWAWCELGLHRTSYTSMPSLWLRALRCTSTPSGGTPGICWCQASSAVSMDLYRSSHTTTPPGTSVTCASSPLITRSCRATKSGASSKMRRCVVMSITKSPGSRKWSSYASPMNTAAERFEVVAALLPVPTTRLSKRRLRPTVIADATDSGSTAPCSSAWPRAGCRLKGRSMRSPVKGLGRRLRLVWRVPYSIRYCASIPSVTFDAAARAPPIGLAAAPTRPLAMPPKKPPMPFPAPSIGLVNTPVAPRSMF
mmetsp:Transcript_4260/g.11579  ORF Transcript_4260/g.11579 Transcript_4260/m.11579 type:complete len:332 (+) Transcript_4260:746-1741(+)